MVFVRAVHTFVAEHGDELEFAAGEEIEVLERDDAFGDGWWRVSRCVDQADDRDAIPKERKGYSRPHTYPKLQPLQKYPTSMYLPLFRSPHLPHRFPLLSTRRPLQLNRPSITQRITSLYPSPFPTRSHPRVLLQSASSCSQNPLSSVSPPRPVHPSDSMTQGCTKRRPSVPELNHPTLSSRPLQQPSELERLA